MQIPAALGMIRNDRRYGKLNWPSELFTGADLSALWQLANTKDNTFVTALDTGVNAGEKLSLTFNCHVLNLQSLFRFEPLLVGDFEFRLSRDCHGVYEDTEVIPAGELRTAIEDLVTYLTPRAKEIVAEAQRLHSKA
jgi:hypothetical protein